MHATHTHRPNVLLALILVAGCLLIAAPACGQLVVVKRHYRVVAIDRPHNIIRVMPADEPGTRASEVLVDNTTRMFVLDQQVPTFGWNLLHPGALITVHGGGTWHMQVLARKIYLVGGGPPK